MTKYWTRPEPDKKWYRRFVNKVHELDKHKGRSRIGKSTSGHQGYLEENIIHRNLVQEGDEIRWNRSFHNSRVLYRGKSPTKPIDNDILFGDVLITELCYWRVKSTKNPIDPSRSTKTTRYTIIDPSEFSKQDDPWVEPDLVASSMSVPT